MQTSTSLAQLLKPSKILQYVTDSEDELWKQADISPTRDDLCNKETLSTGRRIIRYVSIDSQVHML